MGGNATTRPLCILVAAGLGIACSSSSGETEPPTPDTAPKAPPPEAPPPTKPEPELPTGAPEPAIGDFCHGEPDKTACDDGNPCTVDDRCGVGVCMGRSADDGTSCDDADPCTVGDACAAGTCTSSPKDCSGQDDQCNLGVCEAGTGTCLTSPRDDGTTCDDSDICTESDQCTGGTCAGSTLNCSNFDSQCGAGACNAVLGRCEARAFEDGKNCDDSDACTVADSCSGGVCTGTAKDCSALGSECTVGECDPANGECSPTAVAAGTACDDGLNCTDSDQCFSGVCTGTAVDCSDLDSPCGAGLCEPASGACIVSHLPAETSCDDEDPCTGHDVCDGLGVCSGGTALCFACQGLNDGDPCDDGDACTITTTCQLQSGGALSCIAAAEVDCAGFDTDCAVGACVLATGACDTAPRLNGTACDDGDACTESDQCVTGTCAGSNIDFCGADVSQCELPAANELVTQAHPIAVAGGTATVYATIDVAGESDWYELALSAGDRLTARTTPHCGSSLDTVLVLVSNDGATELALDDDSGVNGFSEISEYEIGADGTYYLGVTGYAASGVGSYILEIAAGPPPPCVDHQDCGCAQLACMPSGQCGPSTPAAVEPNETSAQASPIAVDAPALGRLSATFENDWYAVTLNQGEPVAIETSAFCTSTVSPNLTLLAADAETVLAFDANSGINGHALIAQFTPDASGTYLVRVADDFTGTGQYILSVSDLRCLQPSDCSCADQTCGSDGVTPELCEPLLDIPEPGDASMSTLTLGARAHGEIDPAYDADRYTITLDPGDYEIILESYCASDVDTFLTVTDGDGELVATDDDSGAQFFSKVDLTVPVAETYTVEVVANGAATGEYIIVVDAAP